MEYKNTVEVLLHEIKVVEQIIASYKQYEKIPKIEVDRALSKLINLYDLLAMLKETSEEQPGVPSDSVNEDETDQVMQSKLEDSAMEPTPAGSYKEDPESNAEIPARPDSGQGESENIRLESESGTKTKSEVLGDRLSQSHSFINEKVASRQNLRDISSVLQSRPISNIESSIGLNDKFTFIRELFNGDQAQYAATIKRLDNASDFDEATNYLNQNFKWDMENVTVQRLFDLVRRKYLVAK